MWGDGVRVRPAAVAGRFYPGDPDALAALVDALLADVPLPRRRVPPVAVVAPHAGFRFSGPVAATAYAHLAPWRGEVASVVVLGPAHFTPLRGMAIPSVGAFATPLGPVPIDADARAVAAGLSAVVVDDEPHAGEHAIETQLPFLIRALGPGVPTLPIVVGDTPPSAVAALLSTVLGAAATIVVVSTDLSHYLNRAQACERASHSGEPFHLDAAQRILDGCGCTEDDLGNPADRPFDPFEAAGWIASGRSMRRLAHNCSGKHAAMLATARLRGWAPAGYLDRGHPLERAIAATVEDLTGEQIAYTAVDGCGSPSSPSRSPP